MFSNKFFGHLISTPFEKLLLVYFAVNKATNS